MYIFYIFFLHRIEGRGHQGGRGPMFTRAQEAAIVNMVLTNICIRLREIQANIINNDHIFNNIQRISVNIRSNPQEKSNIHEATVSGSIRQKFRESETSAQ